MKKYLLMFVVMLAQAVGAFADDADVATFTLNR